MLDGEGARVIQEAGAGLVCPAGRGVELARCGEQLVTMNVAERLQMGANGHAYGQREFDRDMVVGRMELLLADMQRVR